MSVYQLTVERGTQLHKDVSKGKIVRERVWCKCGILVMNLDSEFWNVIRI